MTRVVRALAFAFLFAAVVLPASAQELEVRQPDFTEGEASVFLNSLELIRDFHKEEFSDSLLWSLALDGLIARLNDPYAEVYTPSEYDAFQEETNGNYAGIGVQITQLNNAVTITKVFRETPAELAGLTVGDRIVGVDGVSAADWNTQQVSDKIRGEVGSEVDVEIMRDGLQRPITRKIQRDSVHVEAVQAAFVEDGIGYLSLERFAQGSAQEVDLALRQLEGARGLIIDLRRNPGGSLGESLLMTDIFTTPGRVLARTSARETPGADPTEEAFQARITERIPDTPMIVLVDPFTASAAEIVAGGLQDYDRALILGERTFGKGVIQQIFELPYNHRLKMTIGTWLTPLGRSLHRSRDATGAPVESTTESGAPRQVTTPGGRILEDAGGIIPDLAVDPDTLKVVERGFLTAAAENNVLFELRLQEFGFAQAQSLRDSGQGPSVRDDAFGAFVDRLVSEGVPQEIVDDPEVREYLRWRARWTVADRMGDQLSEALKVRMERDPQLTEAVRLLRGATVQADLFQDPRIAAR